MIFIFVYDIYMIWYLYIIVYWIIIYDIYILNCMNNMLLSVGIIFNCKVVILVFIYSYFCIESYWVVF